MFNYRPRADLHRHPVPIFVQVESRALLRLSVAESHRYRAELAIQAVAPLVAGVHNLFEHMSHHFLRQLSGKMFRAMVPKTDPPFPVQDVNPHRQVLQHMPEQLRIFEKVRKHDWPRRLLVSSAVNAGNFRGGGRGQGSAQSMLPAGLFPRARFFPSGTLLASMRFCQSLFFLVGMAGCVFAQDAKPVADRLAAQNALFEEQYQTDLRNFPERATAFGDYRYNDKLAEYSLDSILQRHQTDESFLTRLEAIPAAGFSDQDQLSHDLLVRVLEQRIADFNLKEYEMPIN